MMATSEERLKILDMIQNGVISAKEGSKLLKALKTKKGSESNTSFSGTKFEAMLKPALINPIGKLTLTLAFPVKLSVTRTLIVLFLPSEKDVFDSLPFFVFRAFKSFEPSLALITLFWTM